MDIFLHFFKLFILENKLSIFLIVFLSFFIIYLQINLLSSSTAKIIQSIQNNNISLLFYNYKVFLLILFIYIIVFIFFKHLQNNMSLKIKGWIKTKLVEMIFDKNNKNYLETNFINLNSGFHKYSYCFYNIFTNFNTLLLPNLSLIIIISIYLFSKNLILGSLFVICNLIIIYYFIYKYNDLVQLFKKYETQQAVSDNVLLDKLNNFEKIIYRNQYLNEINHFQESINKNTEQGSEYFKSIANFILVINFVIYVFIGLLVFLLIYLCVYKKNISVTLFITIFTILLLYRDRILINIQSTPDYIEYIAKENIILQYLDKIEKENIENEHKILDKINLKFDKIKFDNVYFSYSTKENIIFKNLNLTIDLNKNVIGLLGSSGKGKSSLMKLLIRMYNYEGNIYIDNVNIKNIQNEYIRKNIVYINQTTKLFDKTIYENILYGCENVDNCNEYLSEIFKFPYIKKLFENFDFEKSIGNNGDKLSGGQKQIINIVNGIIQPSKIVILDEPTNALDKNLKKDLIDLILHFKKFKKNIIIITHDDDLNEIFDQVIYI